MGKRVSKKRSLSRQSYKHLGVPVVVWLSTILCVTGLFYNRAQQIQVLGIARGITHRLAAASTGRVQDIFVQVYDRVEKGQPLISIDTVNGAEHIAHELQIKELQAERKTLQATIDHLQAQMIDREQQLVDQAVRGQADHASNERLFSVSVEDARMRVMDLNRELADEELALGTLEDEFKTVKLLVAENAVSTYQLEQAEQRQVRLVKKIAEINKQRNEALLNLEDALTRQQAFAELPDSPLKTNGVRIDLLAQSIRTVTQREIEVQKRSIDEIDQRLENLRQPRLVQLLAPFDGIVSHIGFGLGEVVDVNAPLMQLAQVNPTEVVAYVPAHQADSVRIGMKVEVIRNALPVKIVKDCEVIGVGPVVEQLPPQLWLRSDMPQWGRSFLIRVPAELNLLAGETVGIKCL